MWCISLPSYVIAAGLSHVVQFLGGYLATIHLVSSQLQVYIIVFDTVLSPLDASLQVSQLYWDGRLGRVTGTGRSGKMPGMGRLQSQAESESHGLQGWDEGQQAEERQERQGDRSHSCLGKGPAPAVYLCPVGNFNTLGLASSSSTDKSKKYKH